MWRGIMAAGITAGGFMYYSIMLADISKP